MWGMPPVQHLSGRTKAKARMVEKQEHCKTTGVYGVFFRPGRQILGYVQTVQLRKGHHDTLPHWENGRTSEFIQIINVRFYIQTLRFKITTSWNSLHNDIQRTFTLLPLTNHFYVWMCSVPLEQLPCYYVRTLWVSSVRGTQWVLQPTVCIHFLFPSLSRDMNPCVYELL
jgi:hypothetical protein